METKTFFFIAQFAGDVFFRSKCSSQIFTISIPSLKLTAFRPENGWLEDDPASFWGPATVRGCELLVSSMVVSGSHKRW